MPIGELIDVSEKGLKLLSYDEETNTNIPSLVEGVIRKADSLEYQVNHNENILFTCSDTHQIFIAEQGYKQVKDLHGMFYALDENNQLIVCSVKPTGKTIPIIDVQMENGCYFSGGILSHNTGGNALKFYASVRMDVRRIETLTKGEDAVGARIKVKVVKNKVAPPFKKAEFDLYFDNRGLDKPSQILDSAVAMNFVKKSGAWFSYGDNRIGQGRENTATYLRENPDLCKELETKIRTALANGESVKEIVVQDKETKSSEEVA